MRSKLGKWLHSSSNPSLHLCFLSKGSYLPTMPGDLLFDQKNWKIGQYDTPWSKCWGNFTSVQPSCSYMDGRHRELAINVPCNRLARGWRERGNRWMEGRVAFFKATSVLLLSTLPISFWLQQPQVHLWQTLWDQIPTDGKKVLLEKSLDCCPPSEIWLCLYHGRFCNWEIINWLI